MIQSRNTLTTFGQRFLEAIVNIQRKGVTLPLDKNEFQLDPSMFEYLNDRDYIDVRERSFQLSKKGFELYESLLKTVYDSIGFRPEVERPEPTL
ncbi:MAG TPA: hypothetical protein VJH65_03565 [Candidatus Nanoarchaeia archaeon]|nr:hypothetical protein [Candidatus Pacearchaeota archaeon]HLC87324.1 hypothetical protein [Candidatus Nanoarchaeia archaeon]